MATKKKEKSGWPGYREDVVQLLDELFDGDDGIVRGQMMGHPSWYVLVGGKKKLFVSAWEHGITLKLSEELANEMFEEGRGRPFEPMGPGKAMKGWVYVDKPDLDEIRSEEEMIHAARDYVSGGQG
ncbi:hypothetical protein KDL29_05465 [bacterium]|nr:hypothetical protein [bacterium]